MADEKWIQGAIKRPGALRKQLMNLGLIKSDETIPLELLNKIKSAQIGDTLEWKGKRFKVTRKLKMRATLAVTLRKLVG